MSLGTIKDYTPNFNLIIPEFNISGWHDYLEENFRSIDALFYNLFGINNYNGMWKKLTSYTAGQVVFISDDTNYSGRLVKVLVNHTTTNDDFTTFFTNNPTYYELFADASTAQYYAQQAKDWAVKMDGPVEGSNYSAKYYADIVDSLSTEITALYNIASEIQIVANISTDVENVADNETNINTVSTNISDVSTVSSNITKISNVNDDLTNIDTVASNISAVNTVATNTTDITTVANNITDINTVASISSNVTSVAGNSTNINSVANNNANITSVAQDLTNINAVNSNKTNIDKVATDINSVSAVGSNMEYVLDVAADILKVVDVANNISDVTIVVDDLTNIDNVASNITNINSVGANETNINMVASNQTNINTTATNMSDINTTASNITAIQNAPTYAANAATSAQQAAISAAGTHFKLFQHNWFDYQLNDMAWLRSDTFSWQDGTVYETAYQHLVNDLDIRETQVITFGYPKVNPETTSIEHVATRSPENDVISSGLYAWYDSDYETLYYTQSENPAINDKLYTVNSDPYGYVVWTVTTEDMPSVLPTIETVGSYSIVVYIAEDGHKIVLSNQAQTVEDIYDETGVAWYYILDTENQRFKLPRTKYDFTGLRDAVGKYVPESLPNISYSNIGGAFDINSQSNGAFKFSGTGSVTFGSGSSGYKNRGISFSASDSSSTYQNNAPVQQRATQMYLYFYVGQFSQTATEQTAGLNSELFNGKMDLDLGNITTSGKSYLSGIGMPSDTYETLSLSSGSSYTATVNGFLSFRARATNSTQYQHLRTSDSTSDDSNILIQSDAPAGLISDIFYPIRKGQTVYYFNNIGSGGIIYQKFVYAEGEV